MKGKTPFEPSDKQSDHHKSRQASPHPTYRHQEQEPFSQQTQYRLEKILEEAAHREQKYIQIIQQQQKQLKNQAELYLENLKLIKQHFIEFMSLKQNKQQKTTKIQHQTLNFNKSKDIYRQNSKQFTPNTKKQIQQSPQNNTSQLQPYLSCKIHAYYYTPHVQDYIRQYIPNEMILTLRSLHSNKQLSQQLIIIKDQQEYNNINNLIEKIPFEISTPSHTPIYLQFNIPCDAQIIHHFKHKQLQLELINKQGMFVYAHSTINLKSLLYYEDTPTEWQIKPISFYSALSNQTKVGQLSLKFSNKLQFICKNQQYKIQSSKPMQLHDLKSSINYNDQQSRMIQRISKFKTNNNSLLLGIGHLPEPNSQKYFQTQNQKIILMHRKKKQLDSIQQYKHNNKHQLMNKILNQAITQYYLTQCQIGKPKYLIYNFLNQQHQHKKIYLQHTLTLQHSNDQQSPKIQLLNIEKYIHCSIVHPKLFTQLQQKQLIQLSQETHHDYDMDQEQQSIWTISGMLHPIILKILCLPPNQSLLNKQNLQATYHLTLKITDQYNQEIDNFHTNIILTPPTIQHTFYIHNQQHTTTSFNIPFNDVNQPIMPKNVITNHNNLQYQWDNKWQLLSLEIQHHTLGEQRFYLIINDEQHLQQIHCFQCIRYTYPKLSPTIKLSIGEVYKLKLQFSFDQTTLTTKHQSQQNHPTHKQQQISVLFATSKPQHCHIHCQNQQQMLCQLNKIYQIQARIQSYSPDPQKIIIHALDTHTNTIIKRWLLLLQKQPNPQYKHTYKLFCQHNKPFLYTFQLHNPHNTPQTFRMYSSNLSIMKPPLQLISLISNQTTNIELSFIIKQALNKQDINRPITTILTVTDGTTFNNYLFQITVKIK